MAVKDFFSLENNLFKKVIVGYIVLLTVQTTAIYLFDRFSDKTAKVSSHVLPGNGELNESGISGIFNSYFWVIILSLLILLFLIIIYIIFLKKRPKVGAPSSTNTLPLLKKQEIPAIVPAISPESKSIKNEIESLIEEANFSIVKKDYNKAREIYNTIRKKYDGKFDPNLILYKRVLQLYEKTQNENNSPKLPESKSSDFSQSSNKVSKEIPAISDKKSEMDNLLYEANLSLVKTDIHRARELYKIIKGKYDAKSDPNKVMFNKIIILYKKIDSYPK